MAKQTPRFTQQSQEKKTAQLHWLFVVFSHSRVFVKYHKLLRTHHDQWKTSNWTTLHELFAVFSHNLVFLKYHKLSLCRETPRQHEMFLLPFQQIDTLESSTVPGGGGGGVTP